MKNKVLIKLIVPSLMKDFEIYIPVNERVSKVKALMINSLIELSDNRINQDKNFVLIDPETGEVYENNAIIRETNIKNAKKIILF